MAETSRYDAHEIESGDFGVRRFHDTRLDQTVAMLLPGAVYVTQRPEMLMTILGSCVAVCLYCPETRQTRPGQAFQIITRGNLLHDYTSGT